MCGEEKKGKESSIRGGESRGKGRGGGEALTKSAPKTNKRLMLHTGEACLPGLQEKSVGPRGELSP